MIEAKKKKEFENNTKVNCLRIYNNIRFNNMKMRRVTVTRHSLISVGDPAPFSPVPSSRPLGSVFINFFYWLQHPYKVPAPVCRFGVYTAPALAPFKLV